MDQLLDIDRTLPVSRHRALPVDVFLPTPSHRSPLSKSNVQTRAIVFPQNFETHTSQFLLLLLILLCWLHNASSLVRCLQLRVPHPVKRCCISQIPSLPLDSSQQMCCVSTPVGAEAGLLPRAIREYNTAPKVGEEVYVGQERWSYYRVSQRQVAEQ